MRFIGHRPQAPGHATLHCRFFAGYPHTLAQGGSTVATGSPHAEARPLLPVQLRRVDSPHGHVHGARPLARLHLVHHRAGGTAAESSQLDRR